MWREAAFDFTELHRLGWQIVKGKLVLDLTSASGEVPTLHPTIPERLMSFLCHFSEARWQSYVLMRFALPDGFAAVLAEGPESVEKQYVSHEKLYMSFGRSRYAHEIGTWKKPMRKGEI